MRYTIKQKFHMNLLIFNSGGDKMCLKMYYVKREVRKYLEQKM